MDNDLPAPNPPATNNVEAYLAMLAGVEDLPMPATIDNNVEYYLRYLVENGGGGGGGGETTSYNQLSNKPQINSTTLTGNKSLDDLGIQAKIDAGNKLSADSVDDTSTTNKFVTSGEKTEWGRKYTKPSGGIPKTDLASTVRTSLGKADTALQSISSSDVTSALGYTPYNSTNPNGYTSNTGTITGITMNGSSKGTSGVVNLGTVITAHQDISGKEDKSNKVTSVSANSTDTQYPSAKVVYDNDYSIVSNNLFDNVFDETGRLDPNTGAEVSASTYHRTEFRDLGDTITGTIYITVSATILNHSYVCFYDENKTFLKSQFIWQNTEADTYEINVTGARYFRVATTTNYTGSFYISTEYAGVDSADYSYKKKIFHITDVKKALTGQTIVNFGDSIFGKRRSPNDISTTIEEITGATTYNCGFGGTTAGTHYSNLYDPFTLHAIADSINSGSWTVQDNGITAGGTTIPEYFAETVTLLKSIDFSKVDIITIAYGTNDWNFGTYPIDDPNNNKSINSYAGAIRYSIEKILTAYPRIKIFLCTPIFRYFLDSSYAVIDDSDTHLNTNNVKLTDFIAGLKGVAEEYHLPCIDNYYALGFNRLNRLYYFPSNDGTHPLYTGCHLIAENMAHALTGDYTSQPIDTKLDKDKVKTANSTTAGNVYDVTYINTMIGDVESILTTLTTGSGV
jgi:lysophospholipase L1-like esterase